VQRIGGVVAILLILGLAAVGLISAQKNTTASSPAVVASGSAAESHSPAAAAALHPVNSVSARSQSRADAHTRSAEPTGVAEATTAAPAVPNTPVPNAFAQSKPRVIPPCDKPGGMGLARIVEIDTTGGPGFGFEHFKQYGR
jgi:hypothetical protein